jgi:uncharacterized protein
VTFFSSENRSKDLKRNFAIIMVVFLLGISAAWAQTVDNPAPASREQVLKMMDLLGMKQNMPLMINNIKQTFKDSLWDGIKQRQPDVPEAMSNEINTVLDQAFDTLKADEMIELMVPVYQKYLTKAEADAAIRFYSSPEGSSLLKKTPVMMTEGMQIGAKYGRDSLERIMPELDKRMDEIMKKYLGPAAQPEERTSPPSNRGQQSGASKQ